MSDSNTHPDGVSALDSVAAISAAYERKHGDDELADALGALYQLIGNMVPGDGQSLAGPCPDDLRQLVKREKARESQ